MKLTATELARLDDCALVKTSRLINSGHACRGILDLSPTGFDSAVKAGLLPKPLQVGPRIRLIRAGDVRRFLAKTQAQG
jgi:hypothetical protein